MDDTAAGFSGDCAKSKQRAGAEEAAEKRIIRERTPEKLPSAAKAALILKLVRPD
jgi:hypothetical protein